MTNPPAWQIVLTVNINPAGSGTEEAVIMMQYLESPGAAPQLYGAPMVTASLGHIADFGSGFIPDTQLKTWLGTYSQQPQLRWKSAPEAVEYFQTILDQQGPAIVNDLQNILGANPEAHPKDQAT